MIKGRNRLLLALAAVLAGLVVLGSFLQALRTLIWDLSYFLPGWLITPILLLGLGLAIARELAQGHGGDLALVETGPGGSVFDLTLSGAPEPLPESDDRAADASAS